MLVFGSVTSEKRCLEECCPFGGAVCPRKLGVVFAVEHPAVGVNRNFRHRLRQFSPLTRPLPKTG